MLQDVLTTKRKLEFHKTQTRFVEFKFSFCGIKYKRNLVPRAFLRRGEDRRRKALGTRMGTNGHF